MPQLPSCSVLFCFVSPYHIPTCLSTASSSPSFYSAVTHLSCLHPTLPLVPSLLLQYMLLHDRQVVNALQWRFKNQLFYVWGGEDLLVLMPLTIAMSLRLAETRSR